MGIIYISGDVEAAGPAPGIDLYSMLSTGMCLVDAPHETFYREFKPLNRNYILDAIRVGAKGLECLKPYAMIPAYDPRSKEFNPELVLDVLERDGVDPVAGMRDASDWVTEMERRYPGKLRYCARPIVFDGGFMNYYFIKFLGENPLGHSGEDINSFYRGVSGNLEASISVFHKGEELPHNALRDAIIQAADMRRVLDEMRIRSSPEK